MTQQEFRETEFVPGMKVSYIGCEELQEIATVDRKQNLIGIDVDCDICDHCGYAVEIITWLRCENCTIYSVSGNVVGTEFNNQ